MKDKTSDIKKELTTLNAIFKDIPEDKKKLVNGLIENAAFMRVTLKDLQQEVIDHGAMIATTSGNGFDMIKDNPAQKAYTTMVSRYASVIDQLIKLLPKEDQAGPRDELLEFLGYGK